MDAVCLSGWCADQHRIAVVGEGGLELVVDTAVRQINDWSFERQPI
jgi:hypothetical protein